MNLRLLTDGRVLLDSQRVATITPDNVLQTANGHTVQCSGILDAMQKLATYPITDWIVKHRDLCRATHSRCGRLPMPDGRGFDC